MQFTVLVLVTCQVLIYFNKIKPHLPEILKNGEDESKDNKEGADFTFMRTYCV